MKKLVTKFITFSISFTLTCSTFASETQESELLAIEKMDLTKASMALDSKNVEKSKKKLLRKFNRKIRKAKRKNKSLDEAVLDLEYNLESAYVKSLGAKRRLLKEDKMSKLISKAKTAGSDLTREQIIANLEEITDRSRFETLKSDLVKELRAAGSEEAFLIAKRDEALKQMDGVASLKTSDVSRKIASNYPNFAEVFTYLAILGGSIFGMVALFAIGSAIAIVGGVFLAVLVLVLVIMGFSCLLQISCSNDLKLRMKKSDNKELSPTFDNAIPFAEVGSLLVS